MLPLAPTVTVAAVEQLLTDTINASNARIIPKLKIFVLRKSVSLINN